MALIVKPTDRFFGVKSGQVVRVHLKIKELNVKGEEKERVQVFEGLVLARKHGREAGATITVRKMSGNIGVEKIFPLNLPTITKIEIMKQYEVKQSRPYYLRDYNKRLIEKPLKKKIDKKKMAEKSQF